MLFAEPPRSLRAEGLLGPLVRQVELAIEAEARFAWEAPENVLRLTGDGRLEAGEEYEPSPMEAAGLRALLIRYNECFPRAFPLLSGLFAPTVAAVWREAYRPGTGRLLVSERHRTVDGPSAVWQVYPAGWPVEFTVASVAAAVRDAVGPLVPARVAYDAATSSLRLEVVLDGYELLVTATDVYGAPAPAVEVVLDGRNVGAPPTGPRRRRRPGTGGATVLEGIADSIAAAQERYGRGA